MFEPQPGLVSVLMPVLNEERAVADALDSVLSQTHRSLEVLVMDGRSTDGTRRIVGEVAARDPRVRLLDNPGRAIAAGLNVGLAAARGEFVARVDGHARVNPEYLELGVGHLRRDEGLAAVGGRREGVAHTRSGHAIAAALSSPFGVGNSINHYATTVQETDHASFGVYRTSVARQVGGWDTSLIANEDVDFDFRILGTGARILYDPEMVISWQVRQTVRDLGRQYRRYGRGKGAMVRKNGRSAVRLRHLAAPALVVWLGAAAGAAVLGHPRAAAVMATPYVAGVAGASALSLRQQSGRDREELNPLVLPAAFVAMHTSWGVGFYEGLGGKRPALASQR